MDSDNLPMIIAFCLCCTSVIIGAIIIYVRQQRRGVAEPKPKSEEMLAFESMANSGIKTFGTFVLIVGAGVLSIWLYAIVSLKFIVTVGIIAIVLAILATRK